MDMTLEVIPLPVSDIDRARDFYRDKVGFHVDIDQEVMPGLRIVQLTPPGSGCSIALGDGLWKMTPGPTPEPGSYQGLQLCVADIRAAHAELVARGLDVSETGPVRPVRRRHVHVLQGPGRQRLVRPGVPAPCGGAAAQGAGGPGGGVTGRAVPVKGGHRTG